jgi:hypothetical protein
MPFTYVEYLLVEIFGYLAEWRILRYAGIGEYDVEPALIALDLAEEAVETAEVRYVSGHASYILWE